MPVVFFMAVGSMVFGALAAYNQRGFKRFLAYSAIGHVGYLLIGFSCSTLSGVQGILVYTMVYVVTSLLVWGILLCLSGQSGQKMQYTSELVGLGATQPALAMTLSVCFLSMAGIPPLAGFYAKYLVFLSAMDSSMYVLAFIGVMTSIVGAFNYLRWSKIIWFEALPKTVGSVVQHDEKVTNVSMSQEQAYVLSAGTFFLVFLMFEPSSLLIMAHRMSLVLFVLSISFPSLTRGQNVMQFGSMLALGASSCWFESSRFDLFHIYKVRPFFCYLLWLVL